MTENEMNELSKQIIGCAYKVSNVLGSGFLEDVYVKSLVHELGKSGLKVEPNKNVKVFYNGINVGDFFVDILVNDTIILEIKAVDQFHEVFSAQCLNYLRATSLPLCLLINFGKPKVEIRRLRRGSSSEN